MSLLAIPLAAVGVAIFFAQWITPAGRAITQGLNFLIPNELLQLNELVLARRRGLLNDRQFLDECRKQGIDSTRSEILLRLSDFLLDIADNIALYRREQITRTELENRLEKLGVPAKTIPELMKVSAPIPSVSDVILFAVREAYNEPVARAYGAFEGYEQVEETARKDLNALGLSSEHFRRYWASHWRLPSIEQGYEMYWRGIIPLKSSNPNDLSLMQLMKTQDIMPAWIPKLVAISHTPFTRVDVRRMFALGILDREGVKRAYKDIGYDDEKAEALTRFTELSVSDPEDQEISQSEKSKRKERDLTKSEIISFYKDGLIPRANAASMLEQLGYDREEVEYYLDAADFDIKQQKLRLELSYVRAAYKAGIIRRNEAVSRLAALDVDSKRIGDLIDLWTAETLTEPARPTRSDLNRFVTMGIIDEERWRQEMATLGYSSEHIDWFWRARSG